MEQRVGIGVAGERRGKDVRGGDRILHRKVDADAAHRRHRMRGIADREQAGARPAGEPVERDRRSEEHTSELQSLMRISYAVFCLKKKNKHKSHTRRYKSA